MIIACQGIGYGRVVTALNDNLMKTHIEVVIDLKIVLGDEAFIEQLIPLQQAQLQGGPRISRQPALSRQTCRQAFKHPAYLHRTGDIIGTDRTHLKTAPAETHQQAFLLKRAKGHAYRHAGDAEQLGSGNFHEAFASGKLA